VLGSDELARLTFYVKQQPAFLAQLETTFHEVSNPKHENYGKHLSFEEVVRLQTPLLEHVNMVESHLASIGAIEISRTVAGDKIIATVSPSLLKQSNAESVVFPKALKEAVDMVAGLKKLELLKPAPIKPAQRTQPVDKKADPQACLADRVEPPCLRKAYGIEKYRASNTTNAQAVIVNQGYKKTDLALFLSRYGLPQQTIVKDIGVNPLGGGDDAALDTQYIIATGQLVPTWWVYLDGHAKNPFDNWIVWASNNTDIPYVHSLSVGEPENEFAADNLGPAAITRMNQEMMAMGTRGISIIFASGDSGYVKNQKYGSSSPYVTSVGGVFNGDLGLDVLQVDPISTGGFSSMSVNPKQPWQEDAIKSFLATHGTRPAVMATDNRCCPDVSVYDSGYYIIQGGGSTPIGGTSASAPVLSGMMSLINDQLLNAGKPPLGFLNYFLYQNELAFLDITNGDNRGYAAVKGYDPASGLGTFGVDTFDHLLAAALANHGLQPL
jgi:tripeptidyl-peptidase-1